jgi:hypothetical protein
VIPRFEEYGTRIYSPVALPLEKTADTLVWAGRENLAPTGVPTPDRRARSKSWPLNWHELK